MSPDVDPQEAALFALKVWKYKEGELVSLTMHLGDRLGLYTQMRGQGPLSAAELAEQMSLNERWVLEWFRGQAAADLLVRHADETYELTDAAAEVLANEETSLLFAAGALAPPPDPRLVDKVSDAFTHGGGITWDDQGSVRAANVARSLGVWTRLALVEKVIPSLTDVQAQLERGIDVLEIGCGAAAPMIALAAAFPKSRFLGIDPSELAIKIGKEALAETGLTNVVLEEGYGETFSSDTKFGFVLTFDCLHDMPYPDQTMKNIRSHIAEDGTWLVKEIRCSPDFEANRGNPVLALLYGYSLTSCMPSGLSQDDGMGLGTLGMPPTLLEPMSADAGFTRFEMRDFEEPANLYYEIRP